MKLLASFAAAALLMAVSLPSHAQSATTTIVSGRTTLNFNAGVTAWASGMGATLTDLSMHPLNNGSIVLPLKEGTLDLNTGIGEAMNSGGVVIAMDSVVIKLQNMVFDTTNPTAPIVSALIIVNDATIGRLPLFMLQPPNTLTVPLVPQSGVVQITGFNITLAPAGAAAINSAFGSTVLQAGTPLGTADLYTVLPSPLSPEI